MAKNGSLFSGKRPLRHFCPSKAMRRTNGKSSSILLSFHVDVLYSRVLYWPKTLLQHSLNNGDHMARHTIPRVIDDRLVPFESAHQSLPAIEVGSEAWYAWLTEPTTHSFAFRSPQGTLNARREHSN